MMRRPYGPAGLVPSPRPNRLSSALPFNAVPDEQENRKKNRLDRPRPKSDFDKLMKDHQVTLARYRGQIIGSQ